MDKQPLVARKKQFKQYKEDVRTRGKPFYPYAMLHDTIMSVVVVVIIIALAVIWKWTIPGAHHSAQDSSGWLGSLSSPPADPGTTSFVPRPDWYFYFLFYLLRVFKWPDSVVLGTVGIPTIGLAILIAIPFIDVRAERHPLRRPVALIASILVVVSMGLLTYKGAVAKESLGSENVLLVPAWAKAEGYSNNKTAVAGAVLFAESGCTSCHTYNGAGSSNLGAPDLTAEGAKHRGIPFQIKHLTNPQSVNPTSQMRPFADLGTANLLKLATFLEASKGDVAKQSPGAG